MRLARGILCSTVLLLGVAVTGCAVNGKVVVAKKGDMKLTLARDGELVPADPVELKFWPEAYEGALRVEEVVRHGKAVRKGELLIRFEKESAEAALKTKEIELKEAQMRLEDAKAGLSLLDEDMQLALFTADKDAKDAKKVQDTHLKTEIPLDDDQHAHQRQGTEDSIKQQKEEIDQLVKMYSEDELTEETEEMILSRAKRRLERTIASLKLSDRRHKLMLDTARPQKIEANALAVRSKGQALKKLTATQKNQKALKEMALQKQQMAVEKQESDLEKLRKDMEQFVIRAPADGVVLHGKAGAQAPTALEPKDTCKPFTVLLTLVRPGQVNAQCMIDEKDRFRVESGMSVTVRPAALPETVLSGTLQPLDLLPAKSGQWKAVVRLEKADPKLLPGMKCKVDIVLDKVENALLVPKAAVVKEGGKSVCRVKTGARRPEIREVKVGKTDGNNVVILEGLKQGEEVLIDQPEKKEKGGDK